MTEQQIQIGRLVSRYIESFNCGCCVEALNCFRLPFTWLYPSGPVSVSTREEYLGKIMAIREGLIAQGWTHSSVRILRVEAPAPHLGYVRTIVTRFQGEREMERRLGFYITCKQEGGWRFALHGSLKTHIETDNGLPPFMAE